MTTDTRPTAALQRAGGIAALYVVAADLAAILYFVVLVDYPGAVDPVDKVMLLRDHSLSMYLMHVVSFECVALALIVVTVAIYHRVKERSLAAAQLATAVGLIHAGLLLASVQVFNVGMADVVRRFAASPEQAVSAWQTIEPVAQALGGSGGETVGGMWFLLLSAAALHTNAFPRALTWLGVGIGIAGILSAVPTLGAMEASFGLLQIVWFLWFGIVMLRQPIAAADAAGSEASPIGSGMERDVEHQQLARPPVPR